MLLTSPNILCMSPHIMSVLIGPCSAPWSSSFRPWPFCSIGTREGVTQKNLSGLLPVRDFRLDPSLLYSLPLLALSPNLLIVWVFLSIAYLLAKLRCSWTPTSLFPSLPRSSSLSTSSLFPPLTYVSVEELFTDNAEFFLVDSRLLFSALNANSQPKGLGVSSCLTNIYKYI